MKKKIITLLSCDIVIALVIFLRVQIKKSALSSITPATSDSAVLGIYTESNWLVMLTMLIVGAVVSLMAVSKTDKISHIAADIIFIGIPGAVMSLWWRFIAYMGWGYFSSYQELGAYIGSIMVGVCGFKVILFIIKKVRENGRSQ